MKYWETDKFKKEKKKWYKRLKSSGFKDIELGEDELVRYSFHLTDAYRSGTYDYYLKANEFLASFKFQTKLDQFIWSLHSEGNSCRQISTQLSKHPIFPDASHEFVRTKIASLEAIMLKKAS
jgi:hypothetical protein